MDFNEINKVNLNNISPTKKEKKKPAKESQNEQKEDLKQTPSNPTYWQSAIGVKNRAVSFSGNSQSNDEFIEKQVAKIKSACYWGEDEKTCDDLHRQFMRELLPVKGEKAVEKYASLANMGLRLIWQNEEVKKYNEVLQKVCNTVQDIELYDANTLAHILANITSPKNTKEHISNYTDILCKLLNNQNGSTDEKLDYMNNLISYEYTKNHPDVPETDEICENFDTYCELLKYVDDNNKEILNSKLTPKDHKTIIELFNDESISNENFANFLTKNLKQNYWKSSAAEEIMEVIENITTDEKKKELFSKLIDKRTTTIQPVPFTILILFEKDIDFLNDTMDYFFERRDKEGAYCISMYFDDIAKFFDSVDSSNLDTFKEFSKDMNMENSFEAAKQYQNGKTGLFDVRIAEKQKELEERGINKFEALCITQSSLDGKTGEISEIADEVIDVFYRKKEKGLKGKLSALKSNHIMPRKINSSFYDYEFSDLLNSLKDKNDEFRKENQAFLYSILKANKSLNKYYLPDISALTTIIKNVKDENGVVDRTKAHNAINLVRKIKKYRSVADMLETISTFPKDKQEGIYQKCMSIIPVTKIATENFKVVAQYCFDEKGDIIKENYDFVQKLLCKNLIVYNMDFFNLCDKYPKLKDFFGDLASYSNNIYGLASLGNITAKYAEEDGTLDDNIKNSITKYVKITGSLTEFESLYEACLQKVNEEKVLNEPLFEKAIKLVNYEQKLCSVPTEHIIRGKTCIDILNEELSISKVNFKDKVNILNSLKTIRDFVVQTGDDDFSCLNRAISDIEASLSVDDISLPIDEATRMNFIQNVLYTNSAKETYTEFENTLINSIPKLEEMTNGLKITYPRSQFLSDLLTICDSEEKLEILSKKAGITPILKQNEEDNSLNLTGYNGIIKLNELDKNNPLEKQIYDCLYKFMYRNEVKTGNMELDNQLNHIIKACPEFINVIGKKQHGTQRYTVDVHSLLVLAYSIENPDYLKKLNSLDRNLLKISAIFHDIMKQENVVDKGHQNLSSLYTKSIVKKIIKSSELQDRIYEIIDNHHWSEEYSNAADKDNKSMELAYRFRRPNDFEIAKIMARSDLKAVSSDFYERLKGCLEEANLAPIQKNLDFLYSNGNAIFSNRIISPQKLNNHIETRNGIDYKVINLRKLNDETDMGEYGFMKGIKKKDLKFLVHMVNSHSIYESLNTVKLLSSPLNGGVLSESLITPKYNRTYSNREYGVLLSEINSNIINAARKNQGSGTQKDFSNIIDLIFDEHRAKERKNFKNELLVNLGIPQDGVNDDEYAQFYKTTIASKTSLTEINPSREFKLGNYTITGHQLIDAINKYQDNLIDKEERYHNEIVGYTPKINAVIAKSPSLDKTPAELLKFAYENNLPIILL